MYPVLAAAFFLTLIIGFAVLIAAFLRPPFWSTIGRQIFVPYSIWLVAYATFIVFGTGPTGERMYMPPSTSPYKLPWRSGISRWVSQGNRSFTNHRGLHLYAWDFWMKIGTEVLAAREGRVLKVVQNFDGIGIHSNLIEIEHEDGTRAVYAHIKKDGSVVKVGDLAKQGQLIGYSGMVGQTINPHLHFVVLNKDETVSLPITFSDVQGGVPLAGHSYTSGNADH